MEEWASSGRKRLVHGDELKESTETESLYRGID
jgi:hypothetical protein